MEKSQNDSRSANPDSVIGWIMDAYAVGPPCQILTSGSVGAVAPDQKRSQRFDGRVMQHDNVEGPAGRRFPITPWYRVAGLTTVECIGDVGVNCVVELPVSLGCEEAGQGFSAPIDDFDDHGAHHPVVTCDVFISGFEHHVRYDWNSRIGFKRF